MSNSSKDCVNIEGNLAQPCEMSVPDSILSEIEMLNVGDTIFFGGTIVICILKNFINHELRFTSHNNPYVGGFISYNTIDGKQKAFLTFKQDHNEEENRKLFDVVFPLLRLHPLYTNDKKIYGPSKNQSAIEYIYEINNMVSQSINNFSNIVFNINSNQSLNNLIQLTENLISFKSTVISDASLFNNEIKNDKIITELTKMVIYLQKIKANLTEMLISLKSYVNHFMDDKKAEINIRLADYNSIIQNARLNLPKLIIKEINIPQYLTNELGKLETLYNNIFNLEKHKENLWTGEM
jgi:hypothetical protein